MKKLMLMTALLLTASGCTTPYLNKHFGESTLAARQNQAMNPEAPSDQSAATVDGQVSNAAQDRYHNAYGKPQGPTNVLKIGVGTK